MKDRGYLFVSNKTPWIRFVPKWMDNHLRPAEKQASLEIQVMSKKDWLRFNGMLKFEERDGLTLPVNAIEIDNLKLNEKTRNFKNFYILNSDGEVVEAKNFNDLLENARGIDKLRREILFKIDGITGLTERDRKNLSGPSLHNTAGSGKTLSVNSVNGSDAKGPKHSGE